MLSNLQHVRPPGVQFAERQPDSAVLADANPPSDRKVPELWRPGDAADSDDEGGGGPGSDMEVDGEGEQQRSSRRRRQRAP